MFILCFFDKKYVIINNRLGIHMNKTVESKEKKVENNPKEVEKEAVQEVEFDFEPIKHDVLDWSGKSKETIDLPGDVFDVEIRKDIIAEIVRFQLAKRRAGTHSTKGRADVRGTTKKCKAQKEQGTRHADKRAPIFRKGGITFGPKPRDHAFKLNKRLKKLGLKIALTDRLKAGYLTIMDNLDLSEPKTKALTSKLESLAFNKPLFVSSNFSDNFRKASSNIPNVNLLKVDGLNVYDIVKHKSLIITKDAIGNIIDRLSLEALLAK